MEQPGRPRRCGPGKSSPWRLRARYWPQSKGEGPPRSPFAEVDHLPTIHDAVELLVDEALSRSGGNQTIAARLLGITQSALSKRLKTRSERGPEGA